MGAATEFVKSPYQHMTMHIQKVNFCRYERTEYARQAADGVIPIGRHTNWSNTKS